MSEQLWFNGEVLVERVIRASSGLARARGLLGSEPLDANGALLLPRARQVHTFGMRYPIDVLFCDGDLRVLHVVHEMRPGRVTRIVPGARLTFEMLGGTATDLKTGDALELVQIPSIER